MLDDQRRFRELARRLREEIGGLTCAQCGLRSSGQARGWRAYRMDEIGVDETPELGFWCPECAEREFGNS